MMSSMQTWREKEEDRRRDVLNWICGDDSEEILVECCKYQVEAATEKHHVGTGSWLFENDTFKKWLDARESISALLSAPPGCGKTILASLVAQHIQQQNKQHKVVIFFCSYYDEHRRNSLFALRSLAVQLLPFHSTIPTSLIELFKQDLKANLKALDNISTATRVLECLLRAIPRVHIIIDGLDELRAWSKVSENLQHLLKASREGITKWFFTTRPDPQICQDLYKSGVHEVQCSNDAIKADIKKYLLDSFGQFKDVTVIDPTADHITIDIESNFLWASLLLQNVDTGEIKTLADVQKALQIFPQGLQDIYLRTVEQRFSKLDEDKMKLTERLIAFLIASEQAMTINELAHALIISSQGDLKTKKSPSGRLIEHLGSHLVSLEPGRTGDMTVVFTHKTVYDFFTQVQHTRIPKKLQRFFMTTEAAHKKLGEVCLACLTNPCYDISTSIDPLLVNPKHSFLPYAAVYWHHHLDVIQSPGSDLLARIQMFMNSPSFWSCVAVQSSVAPYKFGRYDRMLEGYRASSGHHLDAPLPGRVGWGCPLPYFFTQVITKEFLRFIEQWHQVLSMWPDRVHYCRMNRDWESRWPSFMKWVQSRKTTAEFVRCLADVENARISTNISPCQLLLEVFSASMLDPRELAAGMIESHCDHCSSERDQSHKTDVVNGVQDKQQSADTAAFLDILHIASSAHVDKDWRLVTINTNYKSSSTRVIPTIAVEYIWSGGDKENAVIVDRKRSRKDGIFDHCMILHRKGQSTLAHKWSSPHFTIVESVFHPTFPCLVFSAETQQICVAWHCDMVIQKLELEESTTELANIDVVHRELHFSEDGHRLWLLRVAMQTERGQSKVLVSVSYYHVHIDGTRLNLNHQQTHSVHYDAIWNIPVPIVLTAWTKEYLIIAAPPLNSDPKFLRLQLSTNNVSVQFETLRETIFFPSTTAFRDPVLQYTTQDGEDLLVLHLRTQIRQRESNTKTGSVSEFMEGLESQEGTMSITTDMEIADEARHLSWSILPHGWRPWDEELDRQSDDLKRHESATLGVLIGKYIATKDGFNVTVRTSLDWRRQAFLSCY